MDVNGFFLNPFFSVCRLCLDFIMLFFVAIFKGMVVVQGNSEARKIRFRVKIHGKPRYIAKLDKKNPIKDEVHIGVQTIVEFHGMAGEIQSSRN